MHVLPLYANKHTSSPNLHCTLTPGRPAHVPAGKSTSPANVVVILLLSSHINKVLQNMYHQDHEKRLYLLRMQTYLQNVEKTLGMQCVLRVIQQKQGNQTKSRKVRLNPFKTAVSIWGQTTHTNSSSLSPNRDCGSKGVNQVSVAVATACASRSTIMVQPLGFHSGHAPDSGHPS